VQAQGSPTHLVEELKKDTGVPIATSWSRAEDRQLWRLGATAHTGYAI